MRQQPGEAEVLARPSDEEGSVLGPAIQPLEIEVGAIHHIKRARLGAERIEQIHVVHLRRCDPDKRGDGAAQIEQRVQLERVLSRFVSCPGKQRHAQIDDRGIQGVDRVGQLQPQILVAIKPPRFRDQDGSEVGIDAPVTAFVGIGQRAPRHRAPNAQVIESPVLRAQTGDDIAQALAEGQLGKGHAQKLVPAGKTSHPVVATVALHALAKLVSRKMTHQLREQGLSKVHGDRNSNRSPPFAHLSSHIPLRYIHLPNS